MTSPIHVDTVRQDELRTAFQLMYQHLAYAEGSRCAARTLQIVERGEIVLDDVLVVREGGEICGMLVCCCNAGGSSQLWPAQVIEDSKRLEIEDALVTQGLARLQKKGAKFVQALLPPVDASLFPSLARNGFCNITNLLVMSHSLAPSGGADLAHSGQCAIETLNDSKESAFADTLERTYDGTCDFPELNGVRSISEIIEGHKDFGIFDARGWFLLKIDHQPSGVLILTEVPELGEWEISYVGVVPEARGKGLGRLLVRKALAVVQKVAERLIVAVDDRNSAAKHLYQSQGFAVTEERQAWLLVF